MTPMSDETDTARVAVIPADREAAADIVWPQARDGSIPDVELWHRIQKGNDDGHRLVQAFARHRLAQPAIDREAVARLLCQQHGGDPDAIASEPHDCWDGPLWTAFVTDADAILALASSNRSEGGGESAGRDVVEAAQFLSDRLDQLEWMDGALEDTLRDYMGHVDPAHDRLKAALTARPDGEATAIPAGMKPRETHAMARQMLADRGRFPSGGEVPFDVALALISQAIAYTPSPTTNAGGEREIARLREALEVASGDLTCIRHALYNQRPGEATKLSTEALERARAALAAKGGAE